MQAKPRFITHPAPFPAVHRLLPVSTRPSVRLSAVSAPETAATTHMDYVRAVAARSAFPYDVNLKDWIRRRSKIARSIDPAIQIGLFEAMTHDFVHNEMTLDDVKAAARQTEHSLGTTRKDNYLPGEADLSPEFPFLYMGHLLIERLRRVIVWKDLVRHISDTPSLLAEHYCRAYPHITLADFDHNWDRNPKLRGLRFRLGCFHYSLLRELHLMAALRSLGYDVRYNIVLDLEYKCDLVANGVPVAVLVKNDTMNNGVGGRKKPLREMFPDVAVVQTLLDPVKRFGKPWLLNKSSVMSIAQDIDRCTAGSAGVFKVNF